MLARAANVERLELPDGTSMRLLADGPVTGGQLSVHQSELASAAGASPHHHAKTTEMIYVVRGSVQVLMGGHLDVARAGDLAVVPPGMVHAFAAISGSDAEVLVAASPGVARFDLYRRLARVLAGGEPAGGLLADQSAYDTYPDDSAVWQRARATDPALSPTHDQERT